MKFNSRFDQSKRLLNAADYGAVFDHVDWKVSSKEMLCLSHKNNFNHPRLGLVIAKKNVRLAVHRNRIKRIVRESFRHHQHELPSADIIILARKGIGELSNSAVHELFKTNWQRLINKAK